MKVLLVLLAIGFIGLANVLPILQKTTISKYKVILQLRQLANKRENNAAYCDVCTVFVDGMNFMIQHNRTDNEIAKFLTKLCDVLNLEQPHVCKNIIEAFTYEMAFVLARAAFTPSEICGAIIDECGQSKFPLNVMWNITVPDKKPPLKRWPQIPHNKPTYKVLHLSDIHIDRQYAIGSEAHCQLDDALRTYAMCCRNYTDDVKLARKPKPIYVPSGPWGMPYACDIPYQTFEAAVRHISTAHTDLDYIIITGDFEAHDSWDYTIDLTRSNIINITNLLLHYFPKIPVYVSIGNHEGVPQDAMAPHTMPEYEQRGPQWLYTLMKEMWSNWLPTPSLGNVHRASYSVYPKPGLKLISINTIYCSEMNFYLYINQVDPDATLQWFIDELLDSEVKGDKVHIISHIPPGDNYCLKGWSFNFFEIVKRFENTIAQQFYGHTHYDHFKVYYDENDNMRPFHFNWISPSVTTYDYNNPSYRIYTIDGGYPGATYNVKDADTYYANITEANINNHPPIWRFEYSTRRFYNMTDLSPKSWSDLSDRLWTDKNLFREFIKLYYRNDYNVKCYENEKCRRQFVCETKKARSYDESFCKSLK